MEASYYQYRFVQRVDDVYAENSFFYDLESCKNQYK